MTEYADTINERLMLDRIAELERQIAALKAQVEWTLIDPSMRFTKHHVLAYPQDGLSSDDTYVMAYSGGYRTGQHALDDNWKYVKKLERPINAPQEPA